MAKITTKRTSPAYVLECIYPDGRALLSFYSKEEVVAFIEKEKHKCTVQRVEVLEYTNNWRPKDVTEAFSFHLTAPIKF